VTTRSRMAVGAGHGERLVHLHDEPLATRGHDVGLVDAVAVGLHPLDGGARVLGQRGGAGLLGVGAGEQLLVRPLALDLVNGRALGRAAGGGRAGGAAAGRAVGRVGGDRVRQDATAGDTRATTSKIAVRCLRRRDGVVLMCSLRIECGP